MKETCMNWLIHRSINQMKGWIADQQTIICIHGCWIGLLYEIVKYCCSSVFCWRGTWDRPLLVEITMLNFSTLTSWWRSQNHFFHVWGCLSMGLERMSYNLLVACLPPSNQLVVLAFVEETDEVTRQKFFRRQLAELESRRLPHQELAKAGCFEKGTTRRRSKIWCRNHMFQALGHEASLIVTGGQKVLRSFFKKTTFRKKMSKYIYI